MSVYECFSRVFSYFIISIIGFCYIFFFLSVGRSLSNSYVSQYLATRS